MKIVYVANYMNHHYLPLCLCLSSNSEVIFNFIATEPFEKGRKNIGYEDLNYKYDFIIRSYESDKSKTAAQDAINNSDVILYGFFGGLRIKKTDNNLVFNVTERIFKEKNNILLFLLRYIKYFFQKHKRKDHILLPMSAYAVRDFRLVKIYKGETYKWGYFTETRHYKKSFFDLKKKHKKPTIIWAGRLIKLKHLDDVIKAVSLLKQDGYDFLFEIIGGGPEIKALKQLSVDLDISDNVVFKGVLSPYEVRNKMENADIFVISSDKREGWGAVLNEAMNSGCCCIASKSIGSAPFLIEHNVNGLLYDGSIDDLHNKMNIVLADEKLRLTMARNAYHTMVDLWSPEVAGERLIKLCKQLLQNRSSKKEFIFEKGPLSCASDIKDGWNDYENSVR